MCVGLEREREREREAPFSPLCLGYRMWVSWFTGFLAGFLFLALIEVCAVAFLLKRLLERRRRPSSSASSSADIASVTYQPPHIFLQGEMWVAAIPAAIKKDTVKIVAQREKASKDHWRRKEISDDCVEIYPSRRHARLENNVLTLMSEDGCEERIEMRGCKVLSVSGGKESSRKWAKKYPIQLESFNQQLLVKSSICLLYLETSWEKETWCQVLRAAAIWTTEKENQYVARKREFHDYCAQLDEAYPAFAKAIGNSSKRFFEDGKGGKLDKDVGPSLSKRQRIWKRVTKKGSSKGNASVYKEVTGTGDLSSSVLVSKPSRHDDLLESHLLSEGSLGNESTGSSSFQSNPEKVYVDEANSFSDSGKNIEYGVLQQDVATPILDQGAMCWNIICSRLFFDGYHSSRFQEACHKLIQKQFSKIVTPGYMGKISCTKLELGSRPPIFHSMQVHRKDSDYIWSFDAVVEYSGGAQIKIDTCLDVRDSASQENVLNQSLEPTLAGAAAADILRKGLETVEESADANVARATDTESGVRGGEKAHSSKGRWKTMLARVADQVSLVPITMSMKLVTLKGTIRVQIKPPPTDRIWFGFTSMPTIELQPEPSIGDHKITTGPVITFITKRIKMLVQETLVLPNCEGIWVPWMIAEMEDWIPVSARPVPWSPLETRDSMLREETPALKDASAVTDLLPASKLGSITSLSENSDQLDELEKPLLCDYNVVSESEPGEPSATLDTTSTPSNVRLRSVNSTDWVDAGNKSSRRAKMLNLGKKVTEKLDEKRRLVVEKVREGIEKYEQGSR